MLQLAHRDLFHKALVDGKCADVTFKIGEEERSVNGALLAFISPVFEGMLFGGIKNTGPNPSVPIEINQIHPEEFDCIVSFAYNNNPKITPRTIFPLILACQRYQIDALYDSCLELLRTNLKNRNFMKYFRFAADQNRFEDKSLKIMIEFFLRNFARCLDSDNFCWFFDWTVNRISNYKFCTQFTEKCRNFIDEAPNDVAFKALNSDGFYEMSLEGMRLLLARSINCQEERIWEAVLRWDRYQQQEDEKLDFHDLMIEDLEDHGRESRLQSVRHLIRFGLMNGAYFVENVVDKGILTDDEEKSVLMYYQVPQRGCGPFSTISRTQLNESTKELPFKLQMSSNYSGIGWKNTYTALGAGENTYEGCSTTLEIQPFILAVFEDPVYIDVIKIAPFHGEEYCLRDVVIEVFRNANWEPLEFANCESSNLNMIAVKPSAIHKLQLSDADSMRRITAVRIRRPSTKLASNGYFTKKYLVVGFLRFYGKKA